MNYTVHALDNDNCDLRYDYDFTNKKGAIQRGREFLNDIELKELYKVEVRNEKGECEWDQFALKLLDIPVKQ